MDILIVFLVTAIIYLFSNLFRQNTEETTFLTLAPIGLWFRPKKGDVLDLRQYFVDKDNNLYSCNVDTWEINPTKGKDILRCSDKTLNAQGEIINTLRSTDHVKVTIRRPQLPFTSLEKINGSKKIAVIPRTDRHFTVIETHVA